MYEKAVKRQQRQYMGYNLVAFSIIFGLFALIVYAYLRQSLFYWVDEELHRARGMIGENSTFVERQLAISASSGQGDRPFIMDKGEEPVKDGEPPDEGIHRGDNKSRTLLPMRIQMIVRDLEGQVLNGPALGRLFWEDTLANVPFSAQSTDAVHSFRLEDGSSYRGITFLTRESGADYYVQLLINSDGEQNIIDSFLQILIVCVLVFIALSIAASYLLSRKTMTPLLRSWERQTEFVENASHELRTPLAIIQNKLEGLLTTPRATILEKADNVAISLAETRRLSKLTTDLMTLARADSGEPLLQKDRFSLDTLIRDLSGPYGELAESQEKIMELELGYGGEIVADKSRIHELMVILLDNALKYTGEGDTIRISSLQREGKAVIRVADTGIGISEEALSRVFDRFYREDKARSREDGGTGLGLSIARWIVDTHGGKITAQKNNPVGTVFEIEIRKS